MSVQDRIIWQPIHLHQPHHDFDILLDRKFAREMFEAKLIPRMQMRMNELGTEMLDRLRYHGASPYIFWGDTALITQINLDAGRGTWIEMESTYGQIPNWSERKPLKYTTHNMDSSSDTLGLLSLFDMWVYYSSELK
ncbi:MAG: hypothetical protein KJ879_00275 [Nanoarchaeota archaeon]|nr:hypothetical protein [Nanoarchaeota archaeon]